MIGASAGTLLPGNRVSQASFTTDTSVWGTNWIKAVRAVADPVHVSPRAFYAESSADAFRLPVSRRAVGRLRIPPDLEYGSRAVDSELHGPRISAEASQLLTHISDTYECRRPASAERNYPSLCSRVTKEAIHALKAGWLPDEDSNLEPSG